MHDLCSEFRQATFPSPADTERLSVGSTRWREVCIDSDNNQDSPAVELLTDIPEAKAFLDSLFGNSPFLTSICLAEPAFVAHLLETGPVTTVREETQRIDELDVTAGTLTQISRELRIAKRRVALAIAAGDIGGIMPLEDVTGALSGFAECAIRCAARAALADAAAKGRIELADPSDPAKDSGYVILALGKLGSGELNYSSDIDLVVLFDPARVRGAQPEQMQKTFIRMTRELVRLLDERTADGYVFRTDLRLRPDPGATPIAVAVPAAEVYYESQGQNWERAAMIKARPVAGDIEAGKAFVDWLTPFVWRKNLDFAAIQDIHSIKRQINAHKGGSTVNVAGHNIKIGRGGIREIEFFAQTQQLIWGGRVPELRVKQTLVALDRLNDVGQVDEETVEELETAYRFLRTVEHRLQMINDEQTQTLPDAEGELRHLAVFLGFEDTASFSAELVRHLRNVENRYARLFEDAPGLGGDGTGGGNLVFTGSDSDPDTLETIHNLGFERPESVDAAIRGWHHGRYRATRSVRSRELLTELVPALLKCLGRTPDPDATFLKFDEFLSGLPSGVQLFSMIQAQPHLLDLLAEIMGEAPRLADVLSRRPSLLDAVLSSDFLDPPPSIGALVAELESRFARDRDFEGILDSARRWANDRRFIVGLQSLRGVLSPTDAAWALSDIAESALAAIKPATEDEFARRHGRIEGEAFCTLAFGKLGGHEMTPTSDLDLVFIYPGEGEESQSDGERPLSRTHYFARLGQRYINAISAPTAEGTLYEVDMRLRPSGNAGPIACSLNAFVQYHENESWTWERMALTRARPVNGPKELRDRIEDELKRLLTMPTDPEKLRNDVAAMRLRMAESHPTDQLWSIKHLRGGLVYLEFIVQYLQLRHAREHPRILSPNTWRAIRNLSAACILDAEAADKLTDGLSLWQALQSQLHLTMNMDPENAPKTRMPLALQEHLARLGGVESFADVEAIIRRNAETVHELFLDIVGLPDPSAEPPPAIP